MLDLIFFKNYLETHQKELCNRDGICKHCTYKKQCYNSVVWNIKNKINRSSLRRIKPFLKRVIDIFPKQVIWFLFVKFFLPCNHTAIEILNNKEEIFNAIELLDDDNSKHTLISMLMYIITGEKSYVHNCECEYEQYFIPEYVGLDNQEIVVDCGAFVGDTFESYLKYNSPPQKYIMYEAKHDYIDKIKHISKILMADDYVVIRPFGVWKENDTLWFSPGRHGGAGGGFISVDSNKKSTKVNVVSLDQDISDKVSFIKMDIEGAETEALVGAKRVIKSTKPKLAICIYHKTTDFWRILLKLDEDYKYKHKLIRQHKGEQSIGDTVLYMFD